MIEVQNFSDGTVTVNIEGVIGVPEKIQFRDENDKVATYDKFRSVAERIKKSGTARVLVNIRSCGGSVQDALLIYDSLRELGVRITTRCYGFVASAATIIAQAGTEGNREVSENSLYLVHRAKCGVEGNSQDLGSSLELLRRTDERIADIYSRRSGAPASVFLELMDLNGGNGKWLTAHEAVGYGLADRIGRDSSGCAGSVTNDDFSLIRNDMNIIKKWNALAELLGIDSRAAAGPETDPEVALPGAEGLPGVENSAEDTWEEIEKSIAQITGDERMTALPTRTESKEDPSIQEVYLDANELAYGKDARNFR